MEIRNLGKSGLRLSVVTSGQHREMLSQVLEFFEGASAWGERVNCAHCGTPLWWTMQGRRPRTIALGLIDDQSGLAIDEEIFVDRRPDWLSAAEGASQSL